MRTPGGARARGESALSEPAAKWKARAAWLVLLAAVAAYGWVTFNESLSGSAAVGEPLPEGLILESLEGETFDLSGARGRPLILWFSSTACAACPDDSAILEEWQRALEGRAQIVAVRVGDDPAAVRAGLLGRSAGLPIYLDRTGAVAQSLGVKTLPAYYFVTGRGTLSSTVSAELARADFARHVELVLQGGPDLAAQVEWVARRLRCQECEGRSAWESDSRSSIEMRDRVREMLLQGMRPAEVLDAFAAEYGEWILLAPPARGFAALAWALPPAALLLGGWVWWRLIARARSRSEAGEQLPEEQSPARDPRLEERIREYM